MIFFLMLNFFEQKQRDQDKTIKIFFKKKVDNKEKQRSVFWRSCMKNKLSRKTVQKKKEKQGVLKNETGEPKIFLQFSKNWTTIF